jgi:fluoride exporter
VKKTLVVATGGIIGAYGRWIFTRLISSTGFPWATLLVNYLGAALLISFIRYSEKHSAPKWWWRPLIATGICGGFTTYSSFAIQIDQAISAHHYLLAVIYPTASLVGTFLIMLLIDFWLDRSEKI